MGFQSNLTAWSVKLIYIFAILKKYVTFKNHIFVHVQLDFSSRLSTKLPFEKLLIYFTLEHLAIQMMRHYLPRKSSFSFCRVERLGLTSPRQECAAFVPRLTCKSTLISSAPPAHMHTHVLLWKFQKAKHTEGVLLIVIRRFGVHCFWDAWQCTLKWEEVIVVVVLLRLCYLRGGGYGLMG